MEDFLENLFGQIFPGSRLTVVGYDLTRPAKKSPSLYLVCKCSCGSEKSIFIHSLLKGRSRSCGCLARELSRSRKANLRHGGSHEPEYSSWSAMMNRCVRGRHAQSGVYQALGMDPEFKDYVKFKDYMGKMPAPGMTLERQNNSVGYYKGNMIWASRKTQANNKSNSKFYEFKGRRMTMSQWSDEVGIHRSTLKKRLLLGWSLEDALSLSKGTRRKQWP